MIEVTDEGQRLPRVSPSGWMPWIAYARRFDPAGPPARVGVLMINLGASEALMKRAIDELPGEVSLAFLAGTPDLPRWLREAHERGHEAYLMLPVEDPAGPGGARHAADRGLAEPGREPAPPAYRHVPRRGLSRLRRSRPARSRSPTWPSRPLIKEIAERGLSLIEINPAGCHRAVHALTVELGTGYARSSTVLDYKLAGQGSIDSNLERLVEWAGERSNDRVPRHDFGVLQPTDAAIDAIVAWRKRLQRQNGVALVPIIGHFECRETCMAKVRVQPAQLRP